MFLCGNRRDRRVYQGCTRPEAVLDIVNSDSVIDTDDRHGICLDIVEACESGKSAPLAALEYAY